MKTEQVLRVLAETEAYRTNLAIHQDAFAVVKVLDDQDLTQTAIEKLLKQYVVEILQRQIREGVRC